ncbi:MAG TPA: Gfo/Idh/MocA family oxidoreductase, partial [Mycobacterium sp.]|nr:Gfo/Idh/MocA family oxidoreductase [Mycobacterium sp.]
MSADVGSHRPAVGFPIAVEHERLLRLSERSIAASTRARQKRRRSVARWRGAERLAMIGVLLIGAGAVVDEHYCYPLRRLEKAGALRVLGVADPNESSAQRVAAQFKQARTHADANLALVAGSYDLAIIASPPGLHADHACAALAQGCHVLSEKPMTTRIADATRMNTAAAQAQRVLGVAFSRRYSANFADVAKLVAEGELGDDLQFSYHEGSTYRWAIATGAAFDRERSGGGALMDRGVHMLDQLNWVFGDPVVVDRCYDDSLVGGV